MDALRWGWGTLRVEEDKMKNKWRQMGQTSVEEEGSAVKEQETPSEVSAQRESVSAQKYDTTEGPFI